MTSTRLYLFVHVQSNPVPFSLNNNSPWSGGSKVDEFMSVCMFFDCDLQSVITQLWQTFKARHRPLWSSTFKDAHTDTHYTRAQSPAVSLGNNQAGENSLITYNRSIIHLVFVLHFSNICTVNLKRKVLVKSEPYSAERLRTLRSQELWVKSYDAGQTECSHIKKCTKTKLHVSILRGRKCGIRTIK